MRDAVFYSPDSNAALRYATNLLQQSGCSFSNTPDETVTHLLLGVPAKEDPFPLLEKLSPAVTVIGGRLSLPGYRVVDLLEDPFYVSENADITARCAIHMAAQTLPVTYKGLSVAVVGWGRIGKCLASHLRALGADVTVVARKEKDLAMLRALGYRAGVMPADFDGYRVLFNTADSAGIVNAPRKCLKIDLASVQGIHDTDAIWARGLPGKLAPESSGRLIAESVLRLIRNGGVSS